jgi:hypothetical protein
MTRWYLHRMHGCIALTVERLDDQRGFTRMWPARLTFNARMRRAMRAALGDLRELVDDVDRPRDGKRFDAVGVVR